MVYHKNYLIKFSFSYHRQLAVFDHRIHALLQLHSCANQLPIVQEAEKEGRVLITVWLVPVRLYLPILMNERSEAR